MTPVDLWAAVAASACCATVAMRANMLKPQHRTWASAPITVWGSLVVLAISLGMAAVNLWAGGHATEREAMVYSMLAAGSSVLLGNLHQQRGSAR